VSVQVLASPEAVAAAAADRFVTSAAEAIEGRGVFRVALCGGSTPRLVYPLLVVPPRVDVVDWRRVEFFWGDERCVPPDHPDSNFGLAYQALLSHLPAVRPEAVHRMVAEGPDYAAGALAYEAELRLAFGTHGDEAPVFDLIWLGMGDDGHTASLFPDSRGLEVTDRWVWANWSPTIDAWRMTLTLPVLNAAREVLFVVTGAGKAEALRRVLDGDQELPAARVVAPHTDWIVDADAAGQGLTAR
jgi:6-phosphogluconolactonase